MAGQTDPSFADLHRCITAVSRIAFGCGVAPASLYAGGIKSLLLTELQENATVLGRTSIGTAFYYL